MGHNVTLCILTKLLKNYGSLVNIDIIKVQFNLDDEVYQNLSKTATVIIRDN